MLNSPITIYIYGLMFSPYISPTIGTIFFTHLSEDQTFNHLFIATEAEGGNGLSRFSHHCLVVATVSSDV
jgi:hypothetical protein